MPPSLQKKKKKERNFAQYLPQLTVADDIPHNHNTETPGCLTPSAPP